MRALTARYYGAIGLALFVLGACFRVGLDIALPLTASVSSRSSSDRRGRGRIHYESAMKVRRGFRDRLNNDTYWRMSFPLSLSGSIIVRQDGWVMEHTETHCFSSACGPDQLQKKGTADVDDKTPLVIDGDVIAMSCDPHYFHFVYETASMLETLHIHGILEEFPDATLLCFRFPLTDVSLQMLNVMEIPVPTRIQHGRPNVAYQATGMMIVPPFHHYHEHREPHASYNRWLLQSIRSRMLPKFTKDTTTTSDSGSGSANRAIFVSRKGYRRGILQEDELFTKLKRLIPELVSIMPDDYSVAEQAQWFASADLIISPHGAALVNLIFTDWSRVTVVEITPESRMASFRQDTKIDRHYLMSCPSGPGEGDDWERQMNCDVDKLVEAIKEDVLDRPTVTRAEIASIRQIPGSSLPQETEPPQ